MVFLAYFDYLGFKEFIIRNDADFQKGIINNIFRDIENALGRGKLKEINDGYIADLSELKINCINFSDTVIFWTNDQSIDALKDLLEVARRFNWICIDYFFPVRGSVVLGDVFDKKFECKSEYGGTYSVNTIFGKGLVQANLRAEQQNWAGTVIDDSIVTFLKENKIRVDHFLNKFAKKYNVPYKQGIQNKEDEWVLHLVESKHKINEEFFENRKRNIMENFSNYNKTTDSEEVQIKIENTIRFLESYK